MDNYTQQTLDEAEEVMFRNKDVIKYRELIGMDREFFLGITQELQTALECYPNMLSETTKIRIERWFTWTKSLVL